MRENRLYIDGKEAENSNQIGGRDITDETPLENQFLAYVEDNNNFVWRNVRNIFMGGYADTTVFDDVIGGATAATSTFRANLYGGNAKTL